MNRLKLDWSFVVLPYGEAWRRKRKLMHAHIRSDALPRYTPTQTAAARRLARDILATPPEPDALYRAVRLNFGQAILKAMYGIDVDSGESDYITLPEKVLADFNEAGIPGRFMVDMIPACE
jgi:cytochrome P450